MKSEEEGETHGMPEEESKKPLTRLAEEIKKKSKKKKEVHCKMKLHSKNRKNHVGIVLLKLSYTAQKLVKLRFTIDNINHG